GATIEDGDFRDALGLTGEKAADFSEATLKNTRFYRADLPALENLVVNYDPKTQGEKEEATVSTAQVRQGSSGGGVVPTDNNQQEEIVVGDQELSNRAAGDQRSGVGSKPGLMGMLKGKPWLRPALYIGSAVIVLGVGVPTTVCVGFDKCGHKSVN